MLQPKLTKVETISPLKLRLFYETGEVKLFDVAPHELYENSIPVKKTA